MYNGASLFLITIFHFRLKPDESMKSIIPLTLIYYLDRYLYCLCGDVCYQSYKLGRVPLCLSRTISSFAFDHTIKRVPGLVPFCSDKCYKKYSINNF